ncbi:N-acetylmuramic acid 6-phosphate etherase [Fluviicola sp.]|jgi:N-acetylmuramic acid 6-phosphate etherase|uniref:N-acetylmuramic acid 6-phosphate etherase n=1 Tax=Fluviicola sp. TaxID=1917219 RepID=UPI00281816B4|nr:N-acetylmuramic acid 6-phosphate etherase [Fluviicola sp.]MDR0803303.1 N-acetylmuramic acid 6-phosphate etherase [Fluviicola sp.]
MKRITESESNHQDLDKLSTRELLIGINQEDHTVPLAVEKEIPQIEKLADVCIERMKNGGRLFYIGSGTSGRLGIVDASECPPTFGVPHGMVIGIIAGGDQAIRKAVEFAEDDREQGWKDLEAFEINKKDIVIGITASGTTPYVISTLKIAKSKGILTGGISCNPSSPLSQLADIPITPVVGPEFVTGSTRMKSGTAQKLVLNMLSTSIMIRLGHVKGNRMVDMQLSNEKLVDRGMRMVMEATGLNEQQANELLLKYGSVRAAVDSFNK